MSKQQLPATGGKGFRRRNAVKRNNRNKRPAPTERHPLADLHMPPEAIACLRVVMLLRQFTVEIEEVVKGVELEGTLVSSAYDWFGNLAYDFGVAALSMIDNTLPPEQRQDKRRARALGREKLSDEASAAKSLANQPKGMQ